MQALRLLADLEGFERGETAFRVKGLGFLLKVYSLGFTALSLGFSGSWGLQNFLRLP